MIVSQSLKHNVLKQFKVWFSLIFISTLLGCNSMPSTSNNLHVERTLVINATADEVWAFAGGWTAIDNLAPTIISNVISNGNQVGSFRIVNLKGGNSVEETMVEKSATSYSYIITKSPLPVSNYKATIGVKDLGHGKSKFSWKSDFIADGVSDAKASKIIAGIYEGGIAVLQNKYNVDN